MAAYMIGGTAEWQGQKWTLTNTDVTTPSRMPTTIACSIETSRPIVKKKLSEIVPLTFGNRHERRKRQAELRRRHK